MMHREGRRRCTNGTLRIGRGSSPRTRYTGRLRLRVGRAGVKLQRQTQKRAERMAGGRMVSIKGARWSLKKTTAGTAKVCEKEESRVTCRHAAVVVAAVELVRPAMLAITVH